MATCTLGDLLAEQAAKHGDAAALADHTTRRGAARSPEQTYRELDDLVNGLSLGLRACGVRSGDRVGVVLANCAELLYLWFAIARTGAVLVPLNPKLTPHERGELLGHAGVSMLIARPEHLDEHPRLRGLRARVSVGGELPGATPIAGLTVAEEVGPDVRVRSSDALAVLYTSGTTGRAKGCVLSHDSFVVPARAFPDWMQATQSDRFLACLPLFHMAGQSFATSAVASGATLSLVDRFSATRFWSQVIETGATLFRHLGEMLALLVEQARQPEEARHGLRAVYGGGASREVAVAFERRFGVRVLEGYGLTETNTVLSNDVTRVRPGSIGRPLSYSDARIADENGTERPVGEISEIQVRRNAAMMREYFAEPELTAAAFVDEWFRTGDLGYRDADGYFYFTGRTKDVVRRHGELIAATEVEEALNRHPAVKLSAVVPVHDGGTGEEVKAFVVPHAAGAPPIDDLVGSCRRFLAEFKVPKYVEFCDNLPYTATNKVDKELLRSSRSLGGTCHEIRAGEVTGKSA